MAAANKPVNELTRLESLKLLEVLDTDPEAEFDAIVKAASLVCDVPISLISLIDDHRQWFKANQGLDGVTETPREQAFCAYAILSDEILEVNDASSDARFADNPLVTQSPNIRFYVGAPLKLEDGSNIGTLCAIDSKPRYLNDKQREIMKHLAIAASKALERRRIREIEQSLKEYQQQFQQMIENQCVATFMIDSQHRVTHWNKACEVLTGIHASKMIGKNEVWRAFYNESRPCLADLVLMNKTNEVGKYYSINQKSSLLKTGIRAESWFENLGGKRRYLIFDASPILDLKGNIVAVVETLQDITEQKIAEEEVKELAFYDALTKLPNRRFILERINLAIASSKRSNKYGALIFIDLNHFKSLNDTKGHDVGDLLLQQVAMRLKSSVREPDMVARIGGDEFLMMLDNFSESKLEAIKIIKVIGQKISQNLIQPYDLNGFTYYATASLGAALLHGNLGKVDEVIKQADMAMYQAKSMKTSELKIYSEDAL